MNTDQIKSEDYKARMTKRQVIIIFHLQNGQLAVQDIAEKASCHRAYVWHMMRWAVSRGIHIHEKYSNRFKILAEEVKISSKTKINRNKDKKRKLKKKAMKKNASLHKSST